MNFRFFSVGSVSKETPESDNDKTCAELKADEGWKTAQNNGHNNSSRPVSVGSEPEQTINANNVVTPRWVEVISVPLMMAYVTRYIFGTDKLRKCQILTFCGIPGVIQCDDLAILSQWLKYITDNVVGLTNLQVRIVFVL
jgi:gamma-syntrophin